MGRKLPSGESVTVTGVGWKKPISISAEKFAQVSKAILAALTKEPIKFTELRDLVAKQLSNFEGSVSWYTISVARELEVQGRLVRHEKPVRYSKPWRSGTRAASAATAGNEAGTRPRGARSDA